MVERIHEIVWGPGTLFFFLFVGALYSVRLGLFPLLGIPVWWKTTVGSLFLKKKETGKGVSQFQSACTALAATIGTGNIAGVATALLAGGPGAVFWMWVSAFLGMATAYGETELGIRYRRRGEDGHWMAGPMLYLEYGLSCRAGGILYAGFCVLASFGMGSMVQANAISETLQFSLSLPAVTAAVILSALSWRVLAGGVRSIAKTAERMVPFSAGLYMAMSIIALFLFRERLWEALGMIVSDAFSLKSAAGGAFGYGISQSLRYGIARGVFSNEAGLGTMAVLNGTAEEADEGVQGQWAVFEVFFDTIVSCTLTALVILCCMGPRIYSFSGNGAQLVGLCFSQALGSLGGYVSSVCVALFAFATIIAWYYMGKQSAAYLGAACGRDLAKLYLFGYLAAVFFGSLWPMEQVWAVSDLCNGLMAAPNLLALTLLSGKVRRPDSRKRT